EVYGLQQTPRVGSIDKSQANKHNGVPLILELLSPAQRPIQVTQNLAQFWSGSYKAVQKEMKSQYPKHYWPDDPATAKATSKTKRFMENNDKSKS
ncbi:MAG: ATP-dependent helicase HrpB, partial [Colwellia sp.]|nr:ATP-dependent helicase HrpB [Colwellia sp.]